MRTESNLFGLDQSLSLYSAAGLRHGIPYKRLLQAPPHPNPLPHHSRVSLHNGIIHIDED